MSAGPAWQTLAIRNTHHRVSAGPAWQTLAIYCSKVKLKGHQQRRGHVALTLTALGPTLVRPTDVGHLLQQCLINKHQTFNTRCFNAGPASQTLAIYRSNASSTNTRPSTHVVLMPDQRHRRWPSIAAMPHQQTPDLQHMLF